MSYEEQIMSKEKYPSKFSPQEEAIVFIILQILFTMCTVLQIGEYINNSRHLARKYPQIFVCGYYLLRGTDNVQGQISKHIFGPNGDYCLYYPSNLFHNVHSFENW